MSTVPPLAPTALGVALTARLRHGRRADTNLDGFGLGAPREGAHLGQARGNAGIEPHGRPAAARPRFGRLQRPERRRKRDLRAVLDWNATRLGDVGGDFDRSVQRDHRVVGKQGDGRVGRGRERGLVAPDEQRREHQADRAQRRPAGDGPRATETRWRCGASMAAKNIKRMRRPAQPPTHSDVHGYAMAVLLVALAVMLTLMTVAMPVWRQQARSASARRNSCSA